MADRHKTSTLSIRPNAGQRAAILERAAASGMSVNAFLLSCALAGSDVAPAPPPRKRTIDPDTLATLQGLRADLGRLGNNANQMAKDAHLGKLPDGSDRGAALYAEVLALSELITAALHGRDNSRRKGAG